MTRSIDQDLDRFKQIVRGKVRQNLRKYITHTEMFGRKGKEIVSIPVPNIDIPHFRHGNSGNGGAGQGEGDVGEAIGGPGDTPGQGQAGNEAGQHVREVELTLEELADMLGEELELPRIVPKGQDQLDTLHHRYNSIQRVGPNSLRHFRRTFKQALKRQIASGQYDLRRPIVIPTREDERFRAAKPVTRPLAQAAALYMMDVSGSMTDQQKELVRIESFWIDTWLKRHYPGLQRRFIVHDAVAHEVDEDTFYRVRESGGTRISSAYEQAKAIIARDFPPADWNLYLFQFSDGDNWGDDNRACLRSLTEDLLPIANLFCYGQVESPYGSGDYLRELRRLGTSHENLVLSEVASRDDIVDSIKLFLGKGK